MIISSRVLFQVDKFKPFFTFNGDKFGNKIYVLIELLELNSQRPIYHHIPKHQKYLNKLKTSDTGLYYVLANSP